MSSGIGCSEAAVLLLSADAVGAVVVVGLDVVLEPDGGGINRSSCSESMEKILHKFFLKITINIITYGIGIHF